MPGTARKTAFWLDPADFSSFQFNSRPTSLAQGSPSIFVWYQITSAANSAEKTHCTNWNRSVFRVMSMWHLLEPVLSHAASTSNAVQASANRLLTSGSPQHCVGFFSCCHLVLVLLSSPLQIVSLSYQAKLQCTSFTVSLTNIRWMEDILHQLIGGLSHYLWGLNHPRWCRISSIRSIAIKSISFKIEQPHHISIKLISIESISIKLVFTKQMFIYRSLSDWRNKFGNACTLLVPCVSDMRVVITNICSGPIGRAFARMHRSSKYAQKKFFHVFSRILIFLVGHLYTVLDYP